MSTRFRALLIGPVLCLLGPPQACSSEEDSGYDCQLDKSEVSISGETLHGGFVAEVSVYSASIPTDICNPESSYALRVFENKEDVPLETPAFWVPIDGLTIGVNHVSYRYTHEGESFYGDAVVEVSEFRPPEEEPFGVITGVLHIDDEQVNIQGSFVAPFCIDLSSDCVSP